MDRKEGTKRLGPDLYFDPQKEKDILEAVDYLASKKSLGHLVSHLLRLAFESPEVYGNGQEVKQLVDKMTEYGMTPTRYNYFMQVSKEMEAMKKKIDTIYDMAYKTYTLAQMGKFLGLEEKSDNCLRATFLLERQVTDLCMSIGVTNLNHMFVSNKLEDTHEKADKVLEFILESYDNIISELKNSLTINVSGVKQEIDKPSIFDVQNNTKVVGETKQQTPDASEPQEDEEIELVEDKSKKDKVDKIVNVPKSQSRNSAFLDAMKQG